MKNNRRGFILLDIVATLAVISTLAVLGTELLRTSLRVTEHATQAIEESQRTDAAIATLRRDVWDARSLSSDTPANLTITASDQSSITWSLDSGDIVRTQLTDTRRWAGAGTGCSFLVGVRSVVLRSTSGEIRMNSELQLVGEAK